MNNKYLINMICLSDQATGQITVYFDLPFPYFRVRFGSYGWWGPWWGWN